MLTIDMLLLETTTTQICKIFDSFRQKGLKMSTFIVKHHYYYTEKIWYRNFFHSEKKT